jgi:hypothetical protein
MQIYLIGRHLGRAYLSDLSYATVKETILIKDDKLIKRNYVTENFNHLTVFLMMLCFLFPVHLI